LGWPEHRSDCRRSFRHPRVAARPAGRRCGWPGNAYSDVVAGCRQTARNGWLVLRSSVLGIVVGFIPGLGASVAVWLAYGHASSTTRPDVPFGQGAIEGVIAPEAANNSKEGGAMLPTLLFAVPGTSSMGILLGAFALLGIEVGPGMVAHDPWIIQMAGWVILVANLLAFPICLAIAPFLTRLAALHRAMVVPFALMASTMAALAISPSAETLVQIVVFGALGTALAHLDWPRAPFVLGFVIGPIH
jgi:putative tricarboxylic transport membrane protein